jgi:hypothetical protein
MLQFFRAGGFPMFVLAAGIAAIVLALRHSPRAAAAQRAVLFLTAGAFVLDLAAVFTNAPDYALRDHAPLLPIVVTGIGEALSPVVLGLLLVAGAIAARPTGTAGGERTPAA